MNIRVQDLIIECESFTLRVAPGEYETFPVVDNKGLFSHLYVKKLNAFFIINIQLITIDFQSFFLNKFQQHDQKQYLIREARQCWRTQ